MNKRQRKSATHAAAADNPSGSDNGLGEDVSPVAVDGLHALASHDKVAQELKLQKRVRGRVSSAVGPPLNSKTTASGPPDLITPRRAYDKRSKKYCRQHSTPFRKHIICDKVMLGKNNNQERIAPVRKKRLDNEGSRSVGTEGGGTGKPSSTVVSASNAGYRKPTHRLEDKLNRCEVLVKKVRVTYEPPAKYIIKDIMPSTEQRQGQIIARSSPEQDGVTNEVTDKSVNKQKVVSAIPAGQSGSGARHGASKSANDQESCSRRSSQSTIGTSQVLL